MWALALAGVLHATSALALSDGEALPAFELPAASGAAVNSSNLRGSVVLIDFWASWCGPCRQSFGLLNDLDGRYRERGLRVIGVNVDETREEAQAFLAQVPAAFTILFDPYGEQTGAFEVSTMPSSFLFGRDGRLRWAHHGFRRRDQAAFEAAVVAALAEEDQDE